jgi:hypothetical protein
MNQGNNNNNNGDNIIIIINNNNNNNENSVIINDQNKSPFRSPTQSTKKPTTSSTSASASASSTAWAPSFVVGSETDQGGGGLATAQVNMTNATNRISSATSIDDVVASLFSSPHRIVGKEYSDFGSSSIIPHSMSMNCLHNNPSERDTTKLQLQSTSISTSTSSALESTLLGASQQQPKHPNKQQFQYHQEHPGYSSHGQQSETKSSSYTSTSTSPESPQQLDADHRDYTVDGDFGMPLSENAPIDVVDDRKEIMSNDDDKEITIGDWDLPVPSSLENYTDKDEGKQRPTQHHHTMQTDMIDQTQLQTRLEWNQLLVHKAFKPVSMSFITASLVCMHVCMYVCVCVCVCVCVWCHVCMDCMYCCALYTWSLVCTLASR